MSNKLRLRRIMPNSIAFDLETTPPLPSHDELTDMTDLLMTIHTEKPEDRQISIKINNKRVAGRNRNSIRRRGKKMVYINYFNNVRQLKCDYSLELKNLIDGATPDEADMEARVYASQNPSK